MEWRGKARLARHHSGLAESHVVAKSSASVIGIGTLERTFGGLVCLEAVLGFTGLSFA
jgi:hypothetical protein